MYTVFYKKSSISDVSLFHLGQPPYEDSERDSPSFKTSVSNSGSSLKKDLLMSPRQSLSTI